MLHELMNDLHRSWVQKYLLRPDVSGDARMLSSPEKLSHSLSFTFSGYLDYPRPQSPSAVDMRGTVLAVPAFTRDDISAGICVESTYADGAPTEIMSRATRFMHYAHNNRTGAMCIISDDGDNGFVEMDFFALASLSNKLVMKLRFESQLFREAFISGSVNFELLEASMVSMVVGYLIHDSIARPYVEPGSTQCINGHAPSFHVSKRKLSIRDHLNLGDNYTKCVLSVYDESVLKKAVPVFAYMSRKSGAHDSILSELVFWGMTDRLERLKPVPQASILTASNDHKTFETSFGVGTTAEDVDNILFGNCVHALELQSIAVKGGRKVSSADSETVFPQISNISENRPQAIPSKCTPVHFEETAHVMGTQSLDSPFPNAFPNVKAAVPIAPAPFVCPTYTTKQNKGPCLMQLLEEERLVKAHRRKLRKREAAFRSNAKRSERRRIARLSQKVTEGLSEL